MGGHVTPEGEPIVLLPIAGRTWRAIIDTGFNGDLQLPEEVRDFVNPRFLQEIESQLAADQWVVEDLYAVDFAFDGAPVNAEATFVQSSDILVGTGLLRHHRLEIHFPARTVLLERVTAG
jgi:predicted aspartyl protease